VNTALASFNTIMRQMTQQKKTDCESLLQNNAEIQI